MNIKLVIFSFFYNRGSEVKDSISSLLKAAPNNSKVVLVNDGSNDNTLDELLKFKNDSKVEIIDQENQGFSKSLARIVEEKIKIYKPEYIAIFGAGDICFPEKYTKQLLYMSENKDVVALGSGCNYVSNSNGVVLRSTKGYEEASKETLFHKVPFTHGTVVYRTDAYLKAGGYNDDFEYCQDWDLYFRLIDLGKVARHRDVLYEKMIFHDGASFNPWKASEQQKYKSLIQTKAKDESLYLEKLNILKDKGIEAATNEIDFIRIYKRIQRNMIIQGELKLAREWERFFQSVSPDKSRLFEHLLSILIAIRFPAHLISSAYSLYKRVKK